jgi:hypothetical protein
MAKLDIAQTAFSGFGLIRRNPIAPLVWGFLQTVLAVVPLLFVLPAMMEMFGAAVASAGTGEDPDMAEMLGLQAQMSMIAPLTWVAGLLSYTVITGATYRAILQPKDRSGFYLRLGMAELMLLVVSIVWAVLLVLAAIPLGLVVGIAAVIGNLVNEGVAILVAVLLGIAAGVVWIWAAIRFSLAVPMSFDRKAFLLFESWKLTDGNALSLFLAGLLNIIVVLLINMVVGGLLAGIGLAVLFSGGGFEALQAENFEALFSPERLQTLIPVGIVLLLLSIAFNGYVTALMTAPLAEAYRQLSAQSEEVF